MNKAISSKFKLMLIISYLLCLAGVVGSVLFYIETKDILVVADFILYGFIFYYGYYAYKHPHGNLLKIIIFIFAVYYGENVVMFFKEADTSTLFNNKVIENIAITLDIVSVVLVSYIGGRLDRVKENKIISIYVLFESICTTLVFLPTNFNFIESIGWFTPSILWLSITLAYLARYDEHLMIGKNTKEKQS